MTERFTRLTLFVPGAPVLKEAVAVPAEWIENDGRFGEAFSFGTVAPAAVAAIDRAPGALVLNWTVDLREGRKEIIAAVERLRDVGALAVRIEQSKMGWDVFRWLEFFRSDDPRAWHRGAVTILKSKKSFQSCGMQAFSLPDVRIDGEGEAHQELASALNIYQLAEDPLLLSGQTFSPDGETPRRVVERWPDTNYPPEHSCHNPYGVWRLGPPGGTGRPQTELAPVFIPALRMTLAALEAKNKKPLARKQVEETRDQAPCMAMKRRDAQKLERERGYADLNPDFAWEQWDLVRRGS